MNRLILAAVTSLVLAIAPPASADDNVIFTCGGKNAVGYTAGSWLPTVFRDAAPIRIVELGWSKGQWTVQIHYGDLKEWTTISSGPLTDDVWFSPAPYLAGKYFSLNLKNMRYSLTDTSPYLINDNTGTASMQIGSCRKAGA